LACRRWRYSGQFARAAGWAINGSKISKPDARCFCFGRRSCCRPSLWPIAWCRPDHILFDLGIFLGFVQLGLFYGPTFSTVQELVPARIRATVVAFYILSLNLIGLGIGITGGGILADYMTAQGHAEPYTGDAAGVYRFVHAGDPAHVYCWHAVPC
jgi:MFS family permease